MELVNNLWVDKNNNMWTASKFTESQAIAASKRLVSCTHCRDCFDCDYCYNCVGCTACINCRNCRDSVRCTDCESCEDCRECTFCTHCYISTGCSKCRGCSECNQCINCLNCKACTGCTNCVRCYHCYQCCDCVDYKSNPERFYVKQIGEIKNITFYLNEGKIEVVSPVLKYSLDEYLKRIYNMYKEDSSTRNTCLREVNKAKGILLSINKEKESPKDVSNKIQGSIDTFTSMLLEAVERRDMDSIIKISDVIKIVKQLPVKL